MYLQQVFAFLCGTQVSHVEIQHLCLTIHVTLQVFTLFSDIKLIVLHHQNCCLLLQEWC